MPHDADASAIVPLYRRHARAFARRRGQHLFERPRLDRFLALLPRSKSVLDLGCGFGQPIARYLSRAGADITGVDTSSRLIALARRAAPRSRWIVGDMRDLSLDREFDGILAWNSFFHLTPQDQRRMFAVFQRHAKPLAALMFTAGPQHGVAMGEFEGEPLYHASLDPAEYRALLTGHGFSVVDHVPQDPDCQGHTIWLAVAGAVTPTR